MVIDGTLASPDETNSGWLAQLRALQHASEYACPAIEKAKQRREQYLSKSMNFIGRGVWDEPVIEQEVSSCLQKWNNLYQQLRIHCLGRVSLATPTNGQDSYG